jgi:hypothetical protein
MTLILDECDAKDEIWCGEFRSRRVCQYRPTIVRGHGKRTDKEKKERENKEIDHERVN